MTSERPFSPELGDQTPAAVQDYIHALEARVTALEAIVQRLEATVQHVTERLQQDSRTSSRPPSSDPPQAIAQRPRRVPSGRRPGGQPGHEGHTRAVVPVEAVDMVRPVQAGALPALPTPVVGRGSCPPAPSGDGGSPGAADSDRVSAPPVELPGLWGGDSGGVARGGAKGWLWTAGPGDRGAGYRGLSPVEAHHPARARGSVRRLDLVGAPWRTWNKRPWRLWLSR